MSKLISARGGKSHDHRDETTLLAGASISEKVENTRKHTFLSRVSDILLLSLYSSTPSLVEGIRAENAYYLSLPDSILNACAFLIPLNNNKTLEFRLDEQTDRVARGETLTWTSNIILFDEKTDIPKHMRSSYSYQPRETIFFWFPSLEFGINSSTSTKEYAIFFCFPLSRR